MNCSPWSAHAVGVAVCVALAAPLAACGSDSDGPLSTWSGGDPDITVSGDISVDEAGLRTRFVGGAAVVTVPLTPLAGAEGAEATVEISITELDTTEGPAGSATVTLGAATQEAEVTISGFDAPTDQAAMANLVLRYRVNGGRGAATGVRSLYHTVTKLGLQVWAPNSLDAGATTTVRAWVRDLDSGDLLPGASVTLGDSTALTDVAGQVAFDVEAMPEAASVELTATASHGGGVVSTHRTISVVPAGAPRLFVSTDKPLYRPGQTIHIRALALARADLTPLALTPVTLEVLDGKDNKVFKEETSTDTFGVASLTAALAPQVNLGDYTIRAVMADLQTERTVEVSEEKLPKFAVQVSFDSPYFTPDEEIAGVVSARYFFGKAVANAAVTIEALNGTGSHSATFSGTTDGEGLLPFILPAEAAPSQLQIEVTDSAGFAVSKQATVAIATPELQVQLVPESYTVPSGGTFEVYVLTRGPLGGPVDATCEIGDHDDVETGAQGVAVVSLDAGTAVYASCTDAAGLTGSAYVQVTTDFGGDSVLVRADQALYAVGEPIEVTLLAPGAADTIYVDRVHRGRIVESMAAAVVDGVATATMQPGETESGTLVIAGYYVTDEQVVVSGDRAVYVQKPGAGVTVTTDSPTYLPGAEATLTFEVKGDDGAGRAAAIGVAIADEAVFALAGSVGPDDVAGFFLLADEPPAIHPFAFSEASASVQAAAGAALVQGGPGNGASASGLTTPVLRAQVVGLVSGWMSTLRNDLREQVQTSADAGLLSSQDDVDALAATPVYDWWGRQLAVTADLQDGYYEDWVYVSLTSSGPDEATETWDDWSGTFTVYLPADQSYNGGETGGGFDDASEPSAGGDWGDEGGGDWDGDGGVAPPADGESVPGAEAPKKRDDFPETLYVNPALITDGSGKATVTLPMADAITEWRVSMIANTADGLVGGGQGGITVYQDFFVDTDLPARLTQNDRLELPIGVFNFSDTDQEVTVEVAEAAWFELSGSPFATVTVPASSSLAVPITVEVIEAGVHQLEVTAVSSTGFQDGIIRSVTVVPDGQRRDVSNSGPLDGSLALTVTFPEDAIDGGHDALLKLMGGPSAQMVDGVDALLKAPNGCFEPMMNSTWINALVLDYLGWTGSTNATLEGVAKGHLDSGVQQCITFECTGGGFTWFGDPSPAHPILTSLALVMFEDIRAVRPLDDALVLRARSWLEGEQESDGHWSSDESTKNQLMPWDDLRTTCTVAAGLATNGEGDAAVLGSGIAWIQGALADTVDTYTLAMCANALIAAAPEDPSTDALVADLLERATTEGDRTWWDSEWPGISNAGGDVIAVETTALAAQALYRLSEPPLILEGALKYLAGKKSPDGNFMSTQGTIQALRVFVAAAKYASGETDAQVTISVAGDVVYDTHIDASNREVVHLVSLSPWAAAGGALDVDISYSGAGKLFYQLAANHYLPWDPASRALGPSLDVAVDWSPTEVTVGQLTVATVTVTNAGDAVGPGDMPMVDVGVPPGFDPDLTELDGMVTGDPNVARYEVKGDRVLIYLHHLGGELSETFEVHIPMSPRYPMEVATPAARAWEFFAPEDYSESVPVVLTVTAAEG